MIQSFGNFAGETLREYSRAKMHTIPSEIPLNLVGVVTWKEALPLLNQYRSPNIKSVEVEMNVHTSWSDVSIFNVL